MKKKNHSNRSANEKHGGESHASLQTNWRVPPNRLGNAKNGSSIFNSILDSVASEHSARLVAMQNATENANELKQDLTLDLNKARQQQVTSEILDIVGGALALEE